MRCPYCGGENSDQYRFCRQCGKPRPAPPASPPAQAGGGGPAAYPPAQPQYPPAQPPYSPPPPQYPPAQPGYPPAQPPYPPQAGPIAQTQFAPQAPAQGAPPAYPPIGQTYPPQPAPGYPPAYPQPFPEAVPVGAPAGKAGRRGLKRPWLVTGILLVLVACLGAAAYAFFVRPAWLPKIGLEHFLVALPQDDGTRDLYLLKIDQDLADGTVLAQGVAESPAAFAYRDQPNRVRDLRRAEYSHGSFLGGSKYLFYWYQEQGKTSVRRIPANGDEEDTLIDSLDENLAGIFFSSSGAAILAENLPDQNLTNCYFASAGEKADQLATGLGCFTSLDGKFILAVEEKDGALTFTRVKTADGDETSILEDQKEVGDYDASADLSRLAYVQKEGDLARLVLLDGENGDVLVESDDYAKVRELQFAPKGSALFYIAENQDGELGLYTLQGKDDEATQVAAGSTLEAAFAPAGNYLVYLLGNSDGDEVLYSHPLKGDKDDVEVASGQDLAYYLLPSPERILVKELDGEKLQVSSAKVNGEDRVELYRKSGVTLESLEFMIDSANLFLRLKETDGKLTMFVTPVDEDSGFAIVEGWESIELLDLAANGKKLAFAGVAEAGQDPSLYTVELKDGEEPVLLDDSAVDYANAAFTANGKEVLYTAVLGEADSQVEVRKAQADGEGSAERLYKGGYLVDVQWSFAGSFFPTNWNQTTEETGFCPGAKAIKTGTLVQDEMKAGQERCYRFSGKAGQIYTLSVESLAEIDPQLALYDRDGNLVANDDNSGPGNDPVLKFTPPDGKAYYLRVLGTTQAEGAYRLSVFEGDLDPAFSAAVPLQPGARTRGEITSGSTVVLSKGYNFATYGILYDFSGQAGQKLTAQLFAKSLGSQLDPQLLLFDPNGAAVPVGDRSVDANGDIVYNLSLLTGGRHYLLIHNNAPPAAENYFFEILLTVP